VNTQPHYRQGNAGNDRKLKGSTPMGGNIVSIGTTD
jgi:hypothetical protein